MKISKRAKNIEPSLTRKLFNMAQNYDNVIDLTLGDPDLSTPDEIKNAAYMSIRENRTHYSANAGLLEARTAVANRVSKKYKFAEYDSSNIILTAGGMEALYLTLSCIIDEGDEVIIFAPYYVNYVQMVEMCGGVPTIINAYGENGFEITKELMINKINSKTVAVIVNSPNNPTGDIIKEADINNICEVAEENDLYIIADEVYSSLVYDNKKHTSVLDFSRKLDNIVFINSMSKEYCMTGWRIGFACANSELVKNMTKMQENIIACAPLVSQYALLYAYANEVSCSDMVKEFAKRRDLLYDGICKIPKLRCVKPRGAFYMFVNIEDTGLKSEEFAEKLLKEKQVAVVPGVAYGESYDNYIRIAFTKDIKVLQKAISEILLFVKNLKQT